VIAKRPAHCHICGKVLNEANWSPSLRKQWNNTCNACNAKRTNNYYHAHRTEALKRMKKYHVQHREQCLRRTRRWMSKLRLKVMQHYSSNLCCRYCGFNDTRALQIDHIDGGGRKHARSIGEHNLYSWLKKNNYPDGFQILCANCNMIKRSENEELKR